MMDVTNGRNESGETVNAENLKPMLVPDTDQCDQWDGWLDEHGTDRFKPVQHAVFKNQFFVGMAELMKLIQEAYDMEKRLRIVVEYDPQAVNASITCYRLRDECIQDRSRHNPQADATDPK